MYARDANLGSLRISNVHLAVTPLADADVLYDVHCRDGKVTGIFECKKHPSHDSGTSFFVDASRKGLNFFATPEINADGKGILLPSLCHAHIHLDKCFLMDQCGELESGTFKEALDLTAQAKAQFVHRLDDVYARGKRLITESIECGVTAMRAHVEVDSTVQLQCLDVALRLKEEFAAYCDIQISAFAQDPLFDGERADRPGDNYALLCDAARTPGVSSVGSAPYVEPTPTQSKQNISLIVELALQHHLHADFHLDYNIDPSSAPLVYDLLAALRAHGWTAGVPRTVTIGHGTRYALFTSAQWDALQAALGDLPVAFVALPQSDMYMMGKGGADRALLPPRGTLPVPFMAARGLRVALSVNNVQNAFTPQGSLDPMGLCALGVAVYQDASEAACRVLLAAVSSVAKQAVGLTDTDGTQGLAIKPGDRADFVLLHDNPSVRSAVLNSCYARSTIRAGSVVATRRAERWTCFASAQSRGWSLRPAHAYVVLWAGLVGVAGVALSRR